MSQKSHRQPEGPGIGSADLNRRRFLQAGAAGALTVAAGGVLAACGSSDSDSAGTSGGSSDPVKFGFSMPYSEVPLVAIIKKLVAANAKREGWDVLLDETQQGNIQDQTSTLDSWVTQHLTAICATPTDPSTLEPIARRAVADGITWTTYGFKMKTAAGGILFPPELAGKVAGKATVDWINQNDPEAQVLILNSPTDVASLARTEIPEKMIKEQTKAKVVAVQPGVEQPQSLQVTEDVLRANPGVSVVVANNDSMALGAAKAFERSDKDPTKVWIIGQDGSPDALKTMKDPNSFLRADSALDIRKLGQGVVDITNRAIERGWKPGDPQEWVELAPTLITVGDNKAIDRFLAVF